MDGTRPRRTRDRIRQGWYARQRSVRFARHLGFPLTAPASLAEAPPCGPPAGAPCLTPLALAGEVFAHVAHLGAVASLLWASLAWRSAERLGRFPWLPSGGAGDTAYTPLSDLA